MKNITKMSLAVLTSLVLAACSSGGGNSPANQSPVAQSETPATPVAPAVPVTPVVTTPNVSNATATGGAYVLSGDDRNIVLTKKTLSDSSNLNFIVVDGQQIRVSNEDRGIYAGTWARFNDNATCCGKYSDVRFGLKESNGPDDKDYFFYNGNVTKSMPISGSATYNGHFVIDADDDFYHYFDDKDFALGTATFNADFGNKTLSGTLSELALQPISVNAAISGNSFTGTAKSGSFRTTADVEGKFYGTNAKELGGIFIDNQKTWGGAFGAAQ